jgi:hypothetical protein
MSPEIVACYRMYAGNCLEIARRVTEPSSRLALLDMAQAWERLAVQAEKNSAISVVYETPPARAEKF